MTEILTDDEILRRMNAPQKLDPHYKHIRPLSEAAETLIDYAANPEGRFMLGLPQIDAMTRGFGRGELAYITGLTHSGKTQVLLNAINNNRDQPFVLFTPDEPTELVLAKLVAVRTGESSELLEARLKAGDERAKHLVRSVARNDFKNLIVVDDALTLGSMMEAFQEAQHHLGGTIACVAVDYLELIPSEKDSDQQVQYKAQALKRWGKEADVPVICMHQAAASKVKRGQPVSMEAMRGYGADTAIMVLGVWRKRDDEDLDAWDRERERDTITVGVAKNKRPPCKTGEHTFLMESETGLIRNARPEDFTGRTSPSMRSAGEVAALLGQRELAL